MTEPQRSDRMPSPQGERLRAEALDWFVLQGNANATAAERAALQAWLQADEAHRQAFAHWQQQWQAVGRIPGDLQSLLQRNLAYDKAMEAASPAGARLQPAHTGVSSAPADKSQGPRRRRVLSACAAALAGVVAGGAGWLAWQQWQHWQEQPVFAQAFGTSRGQLSEVTLPDGSRLQLDTATQLQVAYYRQRRELVLLQGQAVFAVQPDADRPFQVRAQSTRVTVVGTRFSVRSTPELPGGDGVHVAVEEGRVLVEGDAPGAAPENAARPLLLTPGQQVSADAQGRLSPVSRVGDAGIAPWRRHRVRFDNLRLDQALAELARYRDMPLVIRDPAVASLRITGVFDPRELATFRRILPAALPVRLVALEEGRAEVVLAR